MNLQWGDPRTKKFITNVGLVTSNGPHGYNIMACEWTHFVSFAPALITVCIRPNHATQKNILKTKEFGVNLCATDQNVVSSIAGNYSGKSVDKIAFLKELGISFYKAQTIDALMVEGSCLNAECKLIKYVDVGDHPLLIGEMEQIKINDKKPLSYFEGKYHEVGPEIPKPPDATRAKIEKLAKKYSK